MKDASMVKAIYERNFGAAQSYLKEISNEDSRVDPKESGNNINWTLGHMVASRNFIFNVLGLDIIWDEATAAPYMWGSEQLTADKGLDFDAILDAFNASQEPLIKKLESLTEADLTAEHGKGFVWQRLEFFAWHEGYHLGQLALLRRIVGKDIQF